MADNNRSTTHCMRCDSPVYRRHFASQSWDQCLCPNEPRATAEECAEIVAKVQASRPSYEYWLQHGVNSRRVDWVSSGGLW